MEEIRIGIVGLGHRARGGWIPLLQRIGGYRIVAICDPIAALHEPTLSLISNRTDIAVYTNYDEMLANPSIDAVGITVRCREQGALAAQALEAGKHVTS